MKASSGEHYVALDHIRALAAFLVFTWHFTHTTNGTPVSFRYVPALFCFAPLDEGHTGVSLFMTLSGYLFAKLLAGRRIDYSAFLWNRILRLAPLLVVVLSVIGFQRVRAGESIADYGLFLWQGLWLPTLPNGGWSIAVELHFYVLLPVLMWLFARSRMSLLGIIVAAVLFRGWYFQTHGSVQTLAYFTIVGHLDQFLLGMWGTQLRPLMAGRHRIAAGVLIAFLLAYWRFDVVGGFYNSASSPLWVLLPTVEGLAYALLIVWYDNSFAHTTSGLSGFVAKIGAYSYSIYLLHFFFVFDAARLIHRHVMPLSNFYVASVWSFLAFLMMFPLAHLSFQFIESPFLKLRRRYVRQPSLEVAALSHSLVT